MNILNVCNYTKIRLYSVLATRKTLFSISVSESKIVCISGLICISYTKESVDVGCSATYVSIACLQWQFEI